MLVRFFKPEKFTKAFVDRAQLPQMTAMKRASSSGSTSMLGLPNSLLRPTIAQVTSQTCRSTAFGRYAWPSKKWTSLRTSHYLLQRSGSSMLLPPSGISAGRRRLSMARWRNLVRDTGISYGEDSQGIGGELGVSDFERYTGKHQTRGLCALLNVRDARWVRLLSDRHLRVFWSRLKSIRAKRRVTEYAWPTSFERWQLGFFRRIYPTPTRTTESAETALGTTSRLETGS